LEAAVYQRLIATGERVGLQTHIATTESVSLCVPDNQVHKLRLYKSMAAVPSGSLTTTLLC
jgi:hypothetical protein